MNNENDNEDDKPTVVINIDELKALRDEKEGLAQSVPVDLEFNVFSEETDEQSSESNTAPVILFDYQTTLFEQSLNKLPTNYDFILIKDLKELNQRLHSKDFQIVFFYYNANPKAVNQLTAQIRKKFPAIKTVIVAKNLSNQKALAHSKSEFGANGYISLPFDLEKVNEQLLKLLD
jgi:DNA-binding NarL/FixJ family response regulator